ncbi:MAG TPA: homoserine kinase [Gemmatimonadaceae bacterium]|nr:homoserine kinase [Gemmatimonadaceae bacterium]
MRRRAVVRVPGSTANLGAGFDCVGAAVDRCLTASVVVQPDPGAGTVIQRGGALAGLDVPTEEDWIVVGLRAACKAAGRAAPRALRIRVSSNIPVARGLGSSAAAVVAGAVAATGICGFSLTDTQLLDACAEVEGHPDNVAAAIHGGFVLAVPGAPTRVVPLAVARGLTLVFAVPDFEVTTREARAVLPRELPHQTASRAAALSAALVHGLATGDGDTLRVALHDVLHVPYRRSLIHGYDQVCAAAVSAGALGATLSGSGSTLVAAVPERQAPAVAEAMRAAWQQHGVEADTFVNPAQVEGRSLVVHHDCEDAPATAGAA